MNGYGSRILGVDLSTESNSVAIFDDQFARLYLGDNGFAVRLLYDRLQPGIHAFDPSNCVFLEVGSVTNSKEVFEQAEEISGERFKDLKICFGNAPRPA